VTDFSLFVGGQAVLCNLFKTGKKGWEYLSLKLLLGLGLKKFYTLERQAGFRKIRFSQRNARWQAYTP
jgi:hypothetical protein